MGHRIRSEILAGTTRVAVAGIESVCAENHPVPQTKRPLHMATASGKNAKICQAFASQWEINTPLPRDYPFRRYRLLAD
jgi:hypothetical protein